jgi:hypothetical protein
MFEVKRIVIPKEIPIPAQILEVKRQLSEWLGVVEEQFDLSYYILRLARCERKRKYWIYEYELIEKMFE